MRPQPPWLAPGGGGWEKEEGKQHHSANELLCPGEGNCTRRWVAPGWTREPGDAEGTWLVMEHPRNVLFVAHMLALCRFEQLKQQEIPAGNDSAKCLISLSKHQ